MQRQVIALLLVSTCLLSHFAQTVNSAQFRDDYLKEVLQVYLYRFSNLPPHTAELKQWYKLRIDTLLQEICQQERDCLKEFSGYPGMAEIIEESRRAGTY